MSEPAEVGLGGWDCLRWPCCSEPRGRNSHDELEELEGVKGSCDPVLKVTSLFTDFLLFPEPIKNFLGNTCSWPNSENRSSLILFCWLQITNPAPKEPGLCFLCACLVSLSMTPLLLSSLPVPSTVRLPTALVLSPQPQGPASS